MYRYNEQPADLRIPERFGLSAEVEGQLRNLAWEWILVGKTDPAAFAEYVDEFEDWALDEPAIVEIFGLLVEARRAQQASWSIDAATPPLSRAFAELGTVGVVARSSFWCCGTCADGAIGDERDDSRTWAGYVYFHEQDAESMIDDRETYVGYGVFLDAHLTEETWDALSDREKEEVYERLTLELMEDEVIPVLERHGIEVVWNRELRTRILLRNADLYVTV